ncbi:ABC transporter permease, partial [Streptomyces cadmiisoli]
LLVLVCVWQLYKKKYIQAGVAAVFAALLFVWYATTDSVPSQFVDAAPYLTTLLVLALSAQRLRMPKADGMPYRKGQGK